MREAMFLGVIGAVCWVATVGCEPVDDGAATRNKGWDPEVDGLSNVVLDGNRGVFIDTGETVDVMDGCAKTTLDAMKILQDNCASCHDEESPASPGCHVGDTVP